MPIDHVPIDQLEERHLVDLIANGVPEGRTLDYKRDLYGTDDASKREFLGDVSALANTLGGHLLIGMDEEGGVAKELRGIGAANPDKELTRLESITRDGLQPRLTGLQIRAIPLVAGGCAIVVRVARSFNPPHRVIANKANKFYARATGGKYEPDVQQLREMFAMLPTLIERLNQWRRERLDVIAKRPLRQLAPRPGIIVVHVVPLGVFSLGGHRISAGTIAQHWDRIPPYNHQGLSYRINVDGVLIWTSEDNFTRSYVQFNCNGSVESVGAGVISMVPDRKGNEELMLFSRDFELDVAGMAFAYVSALDALGFVPPFAVLVSLLGTEDARVDEGYWSIEVPRITKDVVEFSEVILEKSPAEVKDTARQLRPIFDQLANAGGRALSKHFTPEGEWKLGV